MSDGARTGRYVVLADVVGSRDIDDRDAFEARLRTAFDHVNEAEAEYVSTPLTHMKGIDEFGCVLTSAAAVPDLASGLLDRIHPTRVRFAVASGDIDVGDDRETVAEMDGPAFHRASELLETLASNELYAAVDTGKDADGLFAAALNLLLLEREDLTERQVEVILAYERHGTQTEVGEALGLKQQAVSKTLRRANYERRREIRRGLRRALEAVYD